MFLLLVWRSGFSEALPLPFAKARVGSLSPWRYGMFQNLSRDLTEMRITRGTFSQLLLQHPLSLFFSCYRTKLSLLPRLLSASLPLSTKIPLNDSLSHHFFNLFPTPTLSRGLSLLPPSILWGERKDNLPSAQWPLKLPLYLSAVFHPQTRHRSSLDAQLPLDGNSQFSTKACSVSWALC